MALPDYRQVVPYERQGGGPSIRHWRTIELWHAICGRSAGDLREIC
jgi:hypothetical protein